ncbi:MULTISPECIES: XRE family transcriptional regulator [Pseudomonadaceae]|uniref:HigA2-like helix-turn-helix domain-containing protein n=1 Tax=Pseudomonas mangrovi TaxID=2161748 RepID=A0A2T5PB57_9PSED|nr:MULTISPECIES: XRE family transcriptional regulator [Pseudomonas]PTU74964.1 hypothetical protein DBO85_06785 [Pseudomonas mangrovi]QTN47310.1 XRE family transcriptional regulator [Pseudomonas mendocina]
MGMIEASSGNLYADLGHTDADTMQAKAQTVVAIHQAIEDQQLSLDSAARLTGISRDELLAILSGQFRDHTLSALGRMQMEIHQCTKK